MNHPFIHVKSRLKPSLLNLLFFLETILLILIKAMLGNHFLDVEEDLEGEVTGFASSFSLPDEQSRLKIFGGPSRLVGF